MESANPAFMVAQYLLKRGESMLHHTPFVIPATQGTLLFWSETAWLWTTGGVRLSANIRLFGTESQLDIQVRKGVACERP